MLAVSFFRRWGLTRNERWVESIASQYQASGLDSYYIAVEKLVAVNQYWPTPSCRVYKRQVRRPKEISSNNASAVDDTCCARRILSSNNIARDYIHIALRIKHHVNSAAGINNHLIIREDIAVSPTQRPKY